MFASLVSRPALAAASGAIAIGLAIVVVTPLVFDTPDGNDGGPVTVAQREEQVPGEDDAVALVEPTSMPLQLSGRDLTLDGAATETETRAAAPRSAARPPAAVATDGGMGSPVVSSAPAPAPPQPATAGFQTATRLKAVDTERFVAPPNTETFANAESNPLKIAAEEPVSTFSIDVDTASWSFVRAALMAGRLPPEDTVRIEEMVNYFPYAYAPPAAGEGPFATSVAVFETPWNAGTQLVRIGIQGAMPAVAERPPLDLVFLIDTSGSMQDANKLPLLKQSFRLLLGKLGAADRVAMVTYAGSSGVVLEPTSAEDRGAILAALDRLEAGGSTAGQAGLMAAYALAESVAEEGRVGRVLLATDGDFNVGLSDPEALKDYIAAKRDTGIYLSVLGFGRGNYQDALMQALAQNGNGTAAYIDTLSEAQKVLADQVAGALYPIADDVKIQVEFNPATVAEYRLIGYETRLIAREDFNNDRVDAGDIGAGHAVTALYEVTPVGSPAILTEPLRYGEPAIAAADADTEDFGDEIGFLKLRSKLPGEETSTLVTTPIVAGDGTADADARFAAAIAGFGQLLGNDKYLGDWDYDAAIALANGARGDDPFGYRAEAVTLMRLAQSLSAN